MEFVICILWYGNIVSLLKGFVIFKGIRTRLVSGSPLLFASSLLFMLQSVGLLMALQNIYIS